MCVENMVNSEGLEMSEISLKPNVATEFLRVFSSNSKGVALIQMCNAQHMRLL